MSPISRHTTRYVRHRHCVPYNERELESWSSLNWIFVNIIFQHMVNIEYENRTLQQPQIMYFQIENMFQFNCFTVAVFSSYDVAIFLVFRSEKRKEKNFPAREQILRFISKCILSKIITFCFIHAPALFTEHRCLDCIPIQYVFMRTMIEDRTVFACEWLNWINIILFRFFSLSVIFHLEFLFCSFFFLLLCIR